MTSVVRLPVDLVRGLTQVVRGLAELPLALERTMRETNALIAESRAQLELLREQAGRMMAQLEKMAAVADRLVEGTAPMAAMAEEARRQMALTTEQLAATNRSLEHIVRRWTASAREWSSASSASRAGAARPGRAVRDRRTEHRHGGRRGGPQLLVRLAALRRQRRPGTRAAVVRSVVD